MWEATTNMKKMGKIVHKLTELCKSGKPRILNTLTQTKYVNTPMAVPAMQLVKMIMESSVMK
jgi:hypothetical protein